MRDHYLAGILAERFIQNMTATVALAVMHRASASSTMLFVRRRRQR